MEKLPSNIQASGKKNEALTAALVVCSLQKKGHPKHCLFAAACINADISWKCIPVSAPDLEWTPVKTQTTLLWVVCFNKHKLSILFLKCLKRKCFLCWGINHAPVVWNCVLTKTESGFSSCCNSFTIYTRTPHSAITRDFMLSFWLLMSDTFFLSTKHNLKRCTLDVSMLTEDIPQHFHCLWTSVVSEGVTKLWTSQI